MNDNKYVFKFVISTYILFLYTFFLGRLGTTNIGLIIIFSISNHTFDFAIKGIAIWNLLMLLTRLSLNYKIVRKIIVTEKHLIIYYVNFGVWKNHIKTPFNKIKIINPIFKHHTHSFWDYPIQIDYLNEKGKTIEFFIPPHFGLGIRWNVKEEIATFIEFAKENDVTVDERLKI